MLDSFMHSSVHPSSNTIPLDYPALRPPPSLGMRRVVTLQIWVFFIRQWFICSFLDLFVILCKKNLVDLDFRRSQGNTSSKVLDNGD